MSIFQLTSSRRGWQNGWKTKEDKPVFQLTSSRRGWRCKQSWFYQWINISTHILTKRMTTRIFQKNWNFLFQLTSSRRGWQIPTTEYWWLVDISTHILTKRMTAEPCSCECCEEFQLTSSRRGWLHEIGKTTLDVNFNSHPHEEDDHSYLYYEEDSPISTHILTKRMTRRQEVIDYVINISTHILTKRMTLLTMQKNITMLFQLTSSRRGWHWGASASSSIGSISTHILTKRMT